MTAEKPAPRTRVTALGLMRRSDGRLLLERGMDAAKGEAFYRAPGGGVEFGEYAAAALRREFMEELGSACGSAPCARPSRIFSSMKAFPATRLSLSTR